ncbi:MAG: hypothetical protein CMC44_04055 [Flavobacteriaceae bacterium]|nr:hypothetical protein [Flavobacteriaceae bacterium]|tara:strand:+ start:2956 stop:3357 length:402 start_codon:yes stop_codon:yes gene_type:complete
MSRNNDFAGQYSRIENTTSLKGEIISSGDFRVDGILEGSIKIKGKIVVGKEGLIDGSVSCESADIEGKLKGKINVSGSFNLRSTAIVEGEVAIGKLIVESGASLNAKCRMKNEESLNDVKTLPKINKSHEKTA